MASNFFGQIFRITTFGESHGPAVGVVIDGCPAGLSITKKDIEDQLFFRRPGNNVYTSPRSEKDSVDILSGIFQGQTTGAPIALLIANQEADSAPYEAIKDLYRPGHANFTYLEKYGLFDYRGGGRSSARETVTRVAAGAVAKKLLERFDIDCVAFLTEMGGTSMETAKTPSFSLLREKTYASPIFCPDPHAEQQMMQKITEVRQEGDSLGGIVSCIANLPVGLGDPVYAKLEALLAYGMLSLPASKGFEIGAGFESARLKGSENNDGFTVTEEGRVETTTNSSGGTLGGISTGSPLFFRVAFKPTSSIQKPQQTVSLKGEPSLFEIPKTGKHDPCVAIRAVPVVEAMAAIVLADSLLMQRSARL